METIMDFYALGIQTAKTTARELYKLWISQADGMMPANKLAGRIACMNDELKNELLKILNNGN